MPFSVNKNKPFHLDFLFSFSKMSLNLLNILYVVVFFRRDLHSGSAGRIPGGAGGGLQELAHPLDGQQAEERGKNKSTECASVSNPDSIRSVDPYPDS